MKRIVTVQDISCLGKCSLTVALPIMSAMGIETAIVPTAILSAHTAFKGFTFRDLTGDIEGIFNHWKREKIEFDAIYTGYLGSFRQLELMSRVFDDFRDRNALVFVDPCMADNGRLYSGFTYEFALAMASLASKADIIVPNMTEASFMLGLPYKEVYDEAYAKDIIKRLSALGAKKVVLKGIVFNTMQRSFEDVKGKIGIISYDSETDTYESYFHEKLPVAFHGTGDIFASVCVAALMRGFSLIDALTLAGDFVVQSIKATLSHEPHNWYGVDFETILARRTSLIHHKETREK